MDLYGKMNTTLVRCKTRALLARSLDSYVPLHHVYCYLHVSVGCAIIHNKVIILFTIPLHMYDFNTLKLITLIHENLWATPDSKLFSMTGSCLA